MITVQETDIVENVETVAVTSKFFTFACTDTVTILRVLLDAGGGWRMLNPCLLSIDGTEVSLPCAISAGSHMVELLGEGFSGVGLAMVGVGMNYVTSLAPGGGDAPLTDKVNSLLYSGAGPLIGTPIYDTSVPSSGRDYALDAAYTTAAGYVVTGRAYIGTEDVGFIAVKGNGTVNIKPLKNNATIDIVVSRTA